MKWIPLRRLFFFLAFHRRRHVYVEGNAISNLFALSAFDFDTYCAHCSRISYSIVKYILSVYRMGLYHTALLHSPIGQSNFSFIFVYGSSTEFDGVACWIHLSSSTVQWNMFQISKGIGIRSAQLRELGSARRGVAWRGAARSVLCCAERFVSQTEYSRRSKRI